MTAKDRVQCPVCMGEHDDAIHEATIEVHAWMRLKLQQLLAYYENASKQTRRKALREVTLFEMPIPKGFTVNDLNREWLRL